MRLFTAIDLSLEVRENLRRTLVRLHSAADVRWSPVENLHVTTKFIGEWPEDRLDEMKRTLRGVPAPGPIDIRVRGVGWFETPYSRIFWAGVDAGPELKGSAGAVQAAVAGLGVPVEKRPYAPHLTLARVKDRSQLSALRRAAAALEATDFGCFQATGFFLYLSAGGKYTKLAEFPLTQS